MSRVSSDPKVISSFLLWLAMRGTDLRKVDIRSIGSSRMEYIPLTWNSISGTLKTHKDVGISTGINRIDGMKSENGRKESFRLKANVRPDTEKEMQEDWGVFAVENVKEGDVLVKLPYECTIGVTASDLKDNEALKELIAYVPQEWNECALGIRLLVERCKMYDQKSCVFKAFFL